MDRMRFWLRWASGLIALCLFAFWSLGVAQESRELQADRERRIQLIRQLQHAQRVLQTTAPFEPAVDRALDDLLSVEKKVEAMSPSLTTGGGLVAIHVEALRAAIPEEDPTLRTEARTELLLSDVLDMSRIEAGRLELRNEDFDVEELLDSAVLLFASRAEAKGLELSVFAEVGLPSLLRGDRSRMRQVLLNLISNAIKFTEEGHVRILAGLQVGALGKNPEMAILDLSGHATDDFRRDALRAGMREYPTKPIRLRELRDAVRRQLSD
ncbi:MAG TPA: hypothetical protein QGF58_10160 [Myxococcota bacterium]|nr:hypothetical protein [Myxococcota bacterium]